METVNVPFRGGASAGLSILEPNRAMFYALQAGFSSGPAVCITLCNCFLSSRVSGPVWAESALSLVFTVVLVTDVLLQLDHISGTTYLPVCETRKSAAQNSENN